jgi:GTP-binding protein
MGRDVQRPKVALIGRPNVGKSTLFNRLIGRESRRGGRSAIVAKRAGVTRDRLYGVCEWDGYEFTVIDCGGIGEQSEDPLWLPVAENSLLAMTQADLVVFLTDAQSGLTLGDDAVLKELRRHACPIVVAVNKVDAGKHEADAFEFYKLGYPDVAFISAQSGRRINELLDMVVARIDWSSFPEATPAFAAERYGARIELELLEAPGAEAREPQAGQAGGDLEVEPGGEGGEEYPFAWAALGPPRFVPDLSWRDEPVQLVFAGRQNVGKSSLTNALLGEQRALVAELPGTTRDPLFASFMHGEQRFELLDTAGMKRISRLKLDVDYYALIRAEKGMRSSEVALLTLDGAEGINEQDKRVAAKIEELARAVVVVVNKSDLLTEEGGPLDEPLREAHLDYVRGELGKLPWAEVVYVSALRGRGLDELLSAALRARENFHRRIDNTVLRAVLKEAIALSPPPIVKNRELRFYDFRQVGNCPPAFLVEINEKLLMRQAYRRYLENTLRKHFALGGTHIELVLYEKRKGAKRGG